MPDIITMETHDHVVHPIRQGVIMPILSREQDGVVLAGKRIGTEDDWQMPQGGCEEGQSLLQDALREAHEETGIPYSELGVRFSYDIETFYLLAEHQRGKRILDDGRTFDGQRHKWVLMTYLGTGLPDLSLADDEEFSELRWVTPEWLMAHTLPFRQKVYAYGFDLLRKRGVFDPRKRAA